MTTSVPNPEWQHLETLYNVILPDVLGSPMLGFRDGMWFILNAGSLPQPLTTRAAILRYPDAAGSIVQVVCWYMRENNHHEHAVDLATELALTVSEVVRDNRTDQYPLSGQGAFF